LPFLPNQSFEATGALDGMSIGSPVPSEHATRCDKMYHFAAPDAIAMSVWIAVERPRPLSVFVPALRPELLDRSD
jgi:hypothetical protein